MLETLLRLAGRDADGLQASIPTPEPDPALPPIPPEMPPGGIPPEIDEPPGSPPPVHEPPGSPPPTWAGVADAMAPVSDTPH